jgi:hypothetical protein
MQTSPSRQRYAALREELAQAFDRTTHRRCAASSLMPRDCAISCRLAVEVAENDGISIRLAQFANCCIEVGRDAFPRRSGFVAVQFINGGGLLFAGATTYFGADDFSGKISRGAMQPACQHRTLRELLDPFHQHHKNSLSHILGRGRGSPVMRKAAE